MQKSKLFDADAEFGKTNQNNLKQGEITMINALHITATTVTPLLQIGENGSQRKGYSYNDGEKWQVPLFSANGLRGTLRRIATKQQIEKATELNPSFELSPELFYLYTSGAGLGKLSLNDNSLIDHENSKKIREQAPILSLFGAGLSAISGKIGIADLSPASDQELFGTTSDGKRYPLLLAQDTNFRIDSAKNESLWGNVLNLESIKKWRDEYAEMVTSSKDAKRKGEVEREADSHIQQPVGIEFIIPNVKLTSSVNEIAGSVLTDVEMGCLISSLCELSMMQIGSAKRISFGVLDWTIEHEGEVLLSSRSNPDYVLDRKLLITEKGQSFIGEWEKWLEKNAISMDIFSDK